MEPLGMRQQTYLFKRKSVKNYGFRIRIPLELQPFYDDRKEIKRSLKTADLSAAKRRARDMAQQQHAEFDEFRAKRAGPPRLVLDGGDASIEGICTRWRHEVLGWDAASRVDRPARIDLAESRDNRLDVEPLLKDVLITGKVERVEPVLRFFLHALNVRVDCSEEDYRRFLYRFAETLADTNQQQIQRNEGMVVPFLFIYSSL